MNSLGPDITEADHVRFPVLPALNSLVRLFTTEAASAVSDIIKEKKYQWNEYTPPPDEMEKWAKSWR